MITSLIRRTSYVKKLLQEMKYCREAIHKYERAEAGRRQGPARLRIEGGMPPEQIEQVLAGTKDSPIVKAIEAHLGAMLVRATDRASDRPSETLVQGDRTIAGYSETMRLHDAGIAYGLADLLLELQHLTAHKEEEPKEEARKSAA